MEQRAKSQKTGRTGLAEKVRKAAAAMDGPFTKAALVAALDVREYREARSVWDVLKDMRRRGEIEIVCRGLYRYKGLERRRTLLDVIWHLVRSHRQFTTDEIERLSGAVRATALEYLHCLRKLGYIRQVKVGHWRMISDPGPQTPVNTGKCERLKKRRKSRQD